MYVSIVVVATEEAVMVDAVIAVIVELVVLEGKEKEDMCIYCVVGGVVVVVGLV